MVKDSIRLSEKHGLNPSLLKCPICDNEIGIALNGKLKDDKKAPREMVGLKPCQKCIDKAGDDKVYVLSVNTETRQLYGSVLIPRDWLKIKIPGIICMMPKEEFDDYFKDIIENSKNAS